VTAKHSGQAVHPLQGVTHRGEHRQAAAGAAAEAMGLYRPHFRYDLNTGHFAGLRSLTSWSKNRFMDRNKSID
jgi:hypothetical protein